MVVSKRVGVPGASTTQPPPILPRLHVQKLYSILSTVYRAMQEYFKIRSMQLYSIDIKSYILKRKLFKGGLKGWPSIHGLMNRQGP